MSTQELIHIVLVALYAPVCLLVFLRLFPSLSLTSKQLALAFLAAQVLVLVMAPEQRKPVGRDRVWSLDDETTIPSALASAQLALVSCVTLVTAAYERNRPRWRRLYMQGVALIFLFLAIDEYFGFHDRNRFWKTPFATISWEVLVAMLGMVLVAATLFVVSRTPKSARIWHLCFLAGLAMSAAGALAVEQLRFPEICSTLGFYHNNDCLFYLVEEPLEFLGIWLVLVAALGLLSRESTQFPWHIPLLLFLWPMTWISVIPGSNALRYVELLAFCVTVNALVDLLFEEPPRVYRMLRWPIALAILLWAFTAKLPTNIRYIEYQLLAEQVTVTYELGPALRVYSLDIGVDSLALEFFSEINGRDKNAGLGYSIHLVDQVSGLSIAGSDFTASDLNSTLFRRPDINVYLYKQRLTLDIPPDARLNRALWIVLTTWREQGGEYIRQTITASDHQLLDKTQVILDELVLQAEPVASDAEIVAAFENGIQLVGVAMPASANAGDTLAVTFDWRSDLEPDADYSQFLHFVNEETGDWWGYDQQPLGARLPTRLWYSGLADSETWRVPLPPNLAPGNYAVFTGLYALADQNRLPTSDPIGIPYPNASILLGKLIVESS